MRKARWNGFGTALVLAVACGFSGAQQGSSPSDQTAPQAAATQDASQTSSPASEAAAQPATPPPAPPYQAKFAGDPAHSDAEAQALGYMRVVVRAQKDYKKRHDKYASSLMELAGTGSLTKRMARSTERGDYTVGFKAQKDGYILTLTPKQMDAEHRSFYADEDGVIHADDQKAADPSSPKIK